MKVPVEMDKLLHFIAGAVVYAVAVLILDPVGAIWCVWAAGVGKELWGIEHPNLWNFMWTIVGGFTFYFWLMLYEHTQGKI